MTAQERTASQRVNCRYSSLSSDALNVQCHKSIRENGVFMLIHRSLFLYKRLCRADAEMIVKGVILHHYSTGTASLKGTVSGVCML